MNRIVILTAFLTQLFMGCGTGSEDTAASTTDTSGMTGAIVLDLTCGGKTCIGTEGQ